MSETLAAVLRQPIDWSAMPADSPPALRQLLARCLERDARKRLRDIGEAKSCSKVVASLVGVAGLRRGSGVAVEARRPLWKRVAPLATIAMLAAAIAARAVWYLKPAPRCRNRALRAPADRRLATRASRASLPEHFARWDPDRVRLQGQTAAFRAPCSSSTRG